MNLLADHYWNWERGAGFSGAAKSDGAGSRKLLLGSLDLVLTFLERHIRGDFWDTLGDVSKDEQHGRATGMSLALVHCIPSDCFLVLHCCLVVSAMMQAIFSPLPHASTLVPHVPMHNGLYNRPELLQWRFIQVQLLRYTAQIVRKLDIRCNQYCQDVTDRHVAWRGRSPKSYVAVGKAYPSV